MAKRLLALLCFAGLTPTATLGIYDDGNGAEDLAGWLASREITITSGFTTGSRISLWSSPDTGEAWLVTVVIRNHDAPVLIAGSVELVADERRATLDCTLEGIDSQITTIATAGPSYDHASTAFAVSNCGLASDLLGTLLEAEHIEVQINAGSKSLKRKVLSPKQVRRLQRLHQLR